MGSRLRRSRRSDAAFHAAPHDDRGWDAGVEQFAMKRGLPAGDRPAARLRAATAVNGATVCSAAASQQGPTR